jgi:hypothetical protein
MFGAGLGNGGSTGGGSGGGQGVSKYKDCTFIYWTVTLVHLTDIWDSGGLIRWTWYSSTAMWCYLGGPGL